MSRFSTTLSSLLQGSIVSDLKLYTDMVLLGVDQEFENDQTINDIKELYKKNSNNQIHRLYDEYKVSRDHEDCQLKLSHNKD